MFWSSQYATPHLSALLVSLVLALTAYLWPRLSRFGFMALFAWAAWVNWRTALYTPNAYLDYGDLAVSGLYVEFIRGIFATHVLLFVGAIATCQAMIAAGLLLGDDLARIALVGATIFLVAIAPLGVGSGFPATLIMAVGTVRLFFARDALAARPWSNVVRWGAHPHRPRHA
ncbi:MAG TPA: hypothetical protein VLM85_00325 [Polyangiaceae bacterium]|nr:hypothetical protein [Polyangiaceae bacterium]